MKFAGKLRKLLRVRLRSWGRSNKDIFDDVYRNSRWGKSDNNQSISGKGSLPENTEKYEKFIADYVSDNEINTILDIGCGDFQVSSRILDRVHREVSYLGVDVSSVIIARNKELYESEKVKFQQRDVAHDDIPEAELILVREVLQHLANKDIERIVSRLAARHPRSHILVTNTVARNPVSINQDIPAGPVSRAGIGSGLWLDRPPFNYQVEEMISVPHINHATNLVTCRLLGKNNQ